MSRYKAAHRAAITPTGDEIKLASRFFDNEHRKRIDAEGGEAKIRERLKALEARLARTDLTEAEEKKLELVVLLRSRNQRGFNRSAGIHLPSSLSLATKASPVAPKVLLPIRGKPESSTSLVQSCWCRPWHLAVPGLLVKASRPANLTHFH